MKEKWKDACNNSQNNLYIIKIVRRSRNVQDIQISFKYKKFRLFVIYDPTGTLTQ